MSDEHDLILERPQLHRLAAIYILDWEVSKVRAACRNIREHSDSLTSEITWSFWTGERWAILYRSQMNLNSPTTRGSISKALAERAKFPFNWRAAVDQLCILVPDSWREGEPFLGLNDVEIQPEPPFLVERLLPEENATVVYGDGQAGKSFFAMGVALAVATGKPVGGRWKVARPGPVLYLDWETSKADQALRMKRMGAETEFGPGPWPISYRRMVGPLADQVERIMEWVQERNVALVIYDSLGWATGDELKEAGPAIRVMEATRAIGPTALILAHVTKDEAKKSGQGGPATIFGSKYFELAARYTWHISSTQDELDGSKALHLRNMKANNVRRSDPLSFRLEFEGRGGPIRLVDVDRSSDLSGPSSLGHRLTVALRTGAKSVQELAELTAATEDAISRSLRRMADKGDVRQVNVSGGRGNVARWGLAAPEFAGVQPAFATKVPQEAAQEVGGEVVQEAPEDIPLDERCAICDTSRADRYTPDGRFVCEECGRKFLADQEDPPVNPDTS